MLYKEPPSLIHHNIFLDFKKPPNDNISTGKLNVRFLPSYFLLVLLIGDKRKKQNQQQTRQQTLLNQ